MTKAWPIRAFHLQGQWLVQEWACDPGQANQRHLWNCARNISPTPTPTPSITVKEKNPGATWACCLRMGPIQKQSESKRASSEFPVQTLLTPDPQASEFYMLIIYLFILFLKLDLGFTWKFTKMPYDGYNGTSVFSSVMPRCKGSFFMGEKETPVDTMHDGYECAHSTDGEVESSNKGHTGGRTWLNMAYPALKATLSTLTHAGLLWTHPLPFPWRINHSAKNSGVECRLVSLKGWFLAQDTC